MDLWEEEDADDGRPTIVSERPTAAATGKATKASDRTIPFGTIPDRKTPEVQRSGLVQRLIEQGALEDDLPNRNSSEELRDSEIDLLKLPPDQDDATVIEPMIEVEPMLELVTARASAAPSTAARTPRAASPRIIEGIETEPSSEDQIPTVSVKRPLPPVSVELKNGASALPTAAPLGTGSDREVTERISIPTGMIGSIAPATRTFRPAARERKGLPFWQTALAALVLLGGGISIAKFQAEQRNQTSALSSQPARVSDEEALARPVEPAALPSSTPEAPALSGPPVAASAAPAAAQALPVAAPAAAPPAEIGPPPVLPQRDESLGRTRRVRERTAIASAEPTAPAPAAQAEPVKAAPASKAARTSQPVPAHPSRDQVASSLNSVSSELRKCVGDRHGLAEVTMTVRPAGFVSYAVVAGDYAGTTEGSCIARAVRAAKFPAFSDPNLRVTYPFQL